MVNVGTGPKSPNLVTLDDTDISSYPVTFEINSQFIWIQWSITRIYGYQVGFSGSIKMY